MKINKLLVFSFITTCFSLTACEWQEPLGDAFLNANEEDYKITSCDNLQYIKHNSQDEDYYCAKDESVCKALKEKSENIKCSLWNEHPCNGFDTQKIDGQIVNNFEYAFKYNKCTIKHHECPNMQLKIKEDNYCQNKEIFRCASGQTTCQNEEGEVSCLSPSSNSTCGATCDTPEGTPCGTDKNLSCQKDGSSEAYKCQCFSGYINCDGQCIDPKTDKNHCGANTNTCAELKKCDDDQVCNDGICTCSPGTYFCDEQCKSPNSPKTCGIDEKCEFKTCEENETCAITETGYQCQLTSCDDGYNLCTTDDGRKCISKNDPHNCGGCNIECQNQLPANAINPTCNNAQCDFECETGYLKCDGRCVGIDSKNCGFCGNRCIDGNKCSFNPQDPPEKAQCIQSTCTGENAGKCEATASSSLVCIAENNACGVDCIDCTTRFGSDSTCVDNHCIFECRDGQHPIYSPDGAMEDCADNINTACGSKDMKFEDELVNCTESLNEKNAISSQCVDNKCQYICDETNHLIWSDTENKCVCKNNYYLDNNNLCTPYITTCPTGHHVSEDRKSCVQNSPNACAPTTWDGSGNYTDYVHACGNMSCSEDGICACTSGSSLNEVGVCIADRCDLTGKEHIVNINNNTCDVNSCNNNYEPFNDGNPHGCACSSLDVECDGQCVKSDDNNCGECGKKCQGNTTCINGQCKSTSGENTCQNGQLYCNDQCVDVNNNDEHCGSCGNKCKDGSSCSNGSCCPNGQTNCNGQCIDVNSNNDHCGKCENACQNGQTCSNGNCSCPNGKTLCNDQCVDLSSDNAHCNGCNKKCQDNSTCNNYYCQCNDGYFVHENLCIKNDENNCGSFGNKCGDNRICKDNWCQCNDGYSECGNNDCFNLNNDSNNCGWCGNICDKNNICSNGKCCPNGQTNCNGQCVDVKINNNNCGACGHACGDNQICQNHTCECKHGFDKCDTQCVDLSSDDINCGTCGQICGKNKFCIGGECIIRCSKRVHCPGCIDNDGEPCLINEEQLVCHSNNCEPDR